MPSISDNLTIKDGNSDDRIIRAMDKSGSSDGSLQQMRHFAEAIPIDYSTGGCYQLLSRGVLGAGVPAASPIYSFRWTSTSHLALIRRVRARLFVLGTPFAAGIASFDMYRCTGWTVADSGGTVATLSGDNAALRTSMPASKVNEIRYAASAVLTAGTRTKDTEAIGQASAGVNVSASNQIMFNEMLLEFKDHEHPLVLEQNEGFTVQAVVPATGTWAFTITPYWEEVPLTHY